MDNKEYMQQYHRKHPRLKYDISKQVLDDGSILCYKCMQYKRPEEFDDDSIRWYRNYKDCRCKQCKSLQRKKRLRLNNSLKDVYELLDHRYLGLMSRAKKSGLSVDINKEYLHKLWDMQNGKCAISGIQMTYISNCGRIPTNVSVDRIDSKKGYIKGNIQLVCMAVNQMKNDLDMQTLLTFCDAIILNARKWHHK